LPLIAILSASFGVALRSSTLRPVRLMQSTAQRITASNLNERIPVPSGGGEMASLALLLNEMIDRLEKSFHQVKRFTADTSHELMTPLSVIRLHAERLANDPELPSKFRHSVDEQLQETLHLAETAYSIRVADATMGQNQLAADLGARCHLALTGVLFDFNKSTLKPESDAVLRQVAALMTQDPTLKLEIQGHTDNVGSDAYNQPLSEARARSVVTWLTRQNVVPARLTARGYGKTRPIAANATDEGRAQNRRVEIANPACKI